MKLHYASQRIHCPSYRDWATPHAYLALEQNGTTRKTEQLRSGCGRSHSDLVKRMFARVGIFFLDGEQFLDLLDGLWLELMISIYYEKIFYNDFNVTYLIS